MPLSSRYHNVKTSARNPLNTLDAGRDPSPEMNNLIIDTAKINDFDSEDPDPEIYLSLNDDVLSVKEMLAKEEIKESIFDNIYTETDGVIKDTSEDPIDLEKSIDEIERSIDN